ncbi:MAG: tRNA (guanosine(46)-N7)-methyltransferase TrmB [Bacillota bacterium]|nr:tRNA (guanosine(46)-N7)-methyltransferase TrmB [Bacillota bacterium]
MRLRHDAAAEGLIRASALVYDQREAEANRGRWRQLLGGGKSLHLEIGMGRGRFIIASAVAYPDIAFIGLELRAEMLMQALRRLDGAEPDNLRLLWSNADYLAELFDERELDRIYLNFPDPWPKSRHAKRRLTAPRYLELYRRLLRPGGELSLKTDNRELFEFSLANFRDNGWLQADVDFALPLAKSGLLSEYEMRYRRREQPIFYTLQHI